MHFALVSRLHSYIFLPQNGSVVRIRQTVESRLRSACAVSSEDAKVRLALSPNHRPPLVRRPPAPIRLESCAIDPTVCVRLVVIPTTPLNCETPIRCSSCARWGRVANNRQASHRYPLTSTSSTPPRSPSRPTSQRIQEHQDLPCPKTSALRCSSIPILSHLLIYD